MNMKAVYSLTGDCSLEFYAYPSSNGGHLVSIFVQKGNEKESIVDGCHYSGNYLEVKSTMSENGNHFMIWCDGYHNITSFRVEFDIEKGVAVLTNQNFVLECKKRITVKL